VGLLRTPKRLPVPLSVRVADIVSLELLPNPSTFAQVFAPALWRIG